MIPLLRCVFNSYWGRGVLIIGSQIALILTLNWWSAIVRIWGMVLPLWQVFLFNVGQLARTSQAIQVGQWSDCSHVWFDMQPSVCSRLMQTSYFPEIVRNNWYLIDLDQSYYFRFLLYPMGALCYALWVQPVGWGRVRWVTRTYPECMVTVCIFWYNVPSLQPVIVTFIVAQTLVNNWTGTGKKDGHMTLWACACTVYVA